MLLNVFDKERRKVAVLRNAFDVSEVSRLNGVGSLTFSLPLNDEKNQYCQPFHYVHSGRDFYRILPTERSLEDKPVMVYHCEHVLATLMDRCLFGFTSLGGVEMNTRAVLNRILSKQSHWILGECAFSHVYEYGFSQETLLSALFSVPACFADAYRWDWDTSVYPWKLHLRRLDKNALPAHYIYSRKNLIRCRTEQDFTRLCTRLYPLGYGEGVNQLNISSVNNNLPYLQSPKSVTDKYGIIERVWIDRQYEDAASLKAAAQKMLEELQTPYAAYDVSMIEEAGKPPLQLGEVVQVQLSETERLRSYIIGLRRSFEEDTPAVEVTIANRPSDAAELVADMADRLRVESAYAQGATNLYAQSLQANASPEDGASMHFYVPSEMRYINKVLCKVKLERFRAYSKTTAAGGAAKRTSSASGRFSIQTSGGGGSSTGTGGGGQVQSSTSSGGSGSTDVAVSAQNISDWGVVPGSWEHGLVVNTGYPKPTNEIQQITAQNHIHSVGVSRHKHNITVPAHAHRISFPAHEHSFSVPEHTHSVSIPSHSHTVSGGAHSHEINIPSHTHSVTPGIHRYGSPASFQIFVNGVYRQTVSGTSGEFDLTPWMATHQDGKIGRDRWHRVEIVPDDLSYVVLDLFLQGFVQSRGDHTL